LKFFSPSVALHDFTEESSYILLSSFCQGEKVESSPRVFYDNQCRDTQPVRCHFSTSQACRRTFESLNLGDIGIYAQFLASGFGRRANGFGSRSGEVTDADRCRALASGAQQNGAGA
jgi:hypothetical protein